MAIVTNFNLYFNYYYFIITYYFNYWNWAPELFTKMLLKVKSFPQTKEIIVHLHFYCNSCPPNLI